MEDLLLLLGEECFVCAFLGSILGAFKVYHRQNHKILINVFNVDFELIYRMPLTLPTFFALTLHIQVTF